VGSKHFVRVFVVLWISLTVWESKTLDCT